jgi:hypothetical protein
VQSVDLAMDARWDLALPETFNSRMEAAECFGDAPGGGPPRATISKARFGNHAPDQDQ